MDESEPSSRECRRSLPEPEPDEQLRPRMSRMSSAHVPLMLPLDGRFGPHMSGGGVDGVSEPLALGVVQLACRLGDGDWTAAEKKKHPLKRLFGKFRLNLAGN